LNTGRVGGEGGDSKKVQIADSSAIVQGIVEGTIEWQRDDDFGYEVARSVDGVDDLELLQPLRLYERQSRVEEYQATVARLKKERVEYLAAFGDLDPRVSEGLGG
jgi:phosphoenolpyruvate carboxykinase (ATP)